MCIIIIICNSLRSLIVSSYTLEAPRVARGRVVVVLSPTKRPENVKLQVPLLCPAISNRSCVIFNDDDKRTNTHARASDAQIDVQQTYNIKPNEIVMSFGELSDAIHGHLLDTKTLREDRTAYSRQIVIITIIIIIFRCYRTRQYKFGVFRAETHGWFV